MFTAYKYRIYPTKEQEILFSKTFGCVRYVYNRALAVKMASFQNDKKSLSVFNLMKEMVKWKNSPETKWLREVNSQSLQASLVNLDRAYTNFFKKHAAFPKFKSKHDNSHSFCNPQNTIIDWENKRLFVTKFKDGIKIILSRKFDGTIKSSFISKTPSGKYYVSILVEEDVKIPKCKKPKENLTLGIDLGIANFATFSNGTIINNPKCWNKKQKQLKLAQKKLSKKQKGSKNRNKQRIKVATIHEKISNARKDFLHKLTYGMVKNQDYTSIAIEDLNVTDMLKSGKKNKLSRRIADVGWGMFRTLLTYKCERNGKNLLVIGRFEPSSKLCTCGYLNNNLTLKDREWDCPCCHKHHDRDVLAAQNIKHFAFCKQNTYKDLGQDLPDFKSAESHRGTVKQKCLVKKLETTF